jgi:hypothetical protein
MSDSENTSPVAVDIELTTSPYAGSQASTAGAPQYGVLAAHSETPIYQSSMSTGMVPIGQLPAAAVSAAPSATAPVSFWFHMSDAQKRKDFLNFMLVFVVWAALDIIFDVLFAIETGRLQFMQSLPSFSPFAYFFPFTLFFLIASISITTFANARNIQRVCLLTQEEHEESSTEGMVIWRDYCQNIVPPIVSACFSFLDFMKIFGFIKPHSMWGTSLTDYSGLSKFQVSVDFMSLAFCALPRLVICAATFALAAQWKAFDWVDIDVFSSLWLHDTNVWLLGIMVNGRWSANFQDADEHSISASDPEDARYLDFISKTIVRPVALLFVKAEHDPVNSGFGRRVCSWWYHQEDSENQALNFILYLPLFILLVLMPLLQVLSSIALVVGYFLLLVFHLFIFPFMFPVSGEHLFICYCRLVKYTVGTFCIFSKTLPAFCATKPGVVLPRFDEKSRGIMNLTAVDYSLFSMHFPAWHSGSAIVAAIFGFFMYPLKVVMLTSLSLVLNSIIVIVYLACASGALLLSAVQFIALILTVSVVSTVRAGSFLIAFIISTLWLLISVSALVGLEALLFASALTNPEVGLILYSDVTEQRFRLAAISGFIEDFPGFVLQLVYTILVGSSGAAGRSRVVSLVFSCWRFFVLTVDKGIKLHKIHDQHQAPGAQSDVWEKQKGLLKNSHNVLREILFNVRNKLFPDKFSAALRLVIFGAYAILFGVLASQSVFSSSGLVSYLDANLPVPRVCTTSARDYSLCSMNSICDGSTCSCPPGFVKESNNCVLGCGRDSTSLKVCDRNAQCSAGACYCNKGYAGNGQICTEGELGNCKTSPCDLMQTCTDLPAGGHTCTCPSWMDGSRLYKSTCSCPLSDYPVPHFDRSVCVTSKSSMSQGQVAGIVVGVLCFVAVCIFGAYLTFKKKCSEACFKLSLIFFYLPCILCLILIPAHGPFFSSPRIPCGTNSSDFKLCIQESSCDALKRCACPTGYYGDGISYCTVGGAQFFTGSCQQFGSYHNCKYQFSGSSCLDNSGGGYSCYCDYRGYYGHPRYNDCRNYKSDHDCGSPSSGLYSCNSGNLLLSNAIFVVATAISLVVLF